LSAPGHDQSKIVSFPLKFEEPLYDRVVGGEVPSVLDDLPELTIPQSSMRSALQDDKLFRCSCVSTRTSSPAPIRVDDHDMIARLLCSSMGHTWNRHLCHGHPSKRCIRCGTTLWASTPPPRAVAVLAGRR